MAFFLHTPFIFSSGFIFTGPEKAELYMGGGSVSAGTWLQSTLCVVV